MIPAVAIVAGVAMLVLGRGAANAACAVLCAASIAHAARTLADDSPAALVGVVCAALLAVTLVGSALSLIALAAIAWTFAARQRTGALVGTSVITAVIAALIEPAAIALVPIAGARLPAQPRWTLAIPFLGLVGVIVAIMAGAAREGPLADLGTRWFGMPAAPVDLSTSLLLLADALGPMLAVAALAGAFVLARDLAAAACIAGALLVDVRAGVPGATTLGLAALAAGIAVGRLGATIRIASGQAIVTGTCAAILLLPPTWLAISR